MPKGAFAAAFVATMAIGYSGVYLALSVLPEPEVSLPEFTLGGATSAPEDAGLNSPFPAVFGTPPVQPPPAPPPPTPTQSTKYFLKGLIARNTGSWAVLTDGNREFLVQVGDALEDGAVVAVIDRHGVTLDRNGALSQVGFAGTSVSSTQPDDPASETGQERAEIANITTTRTQLDLTGLDPNDLTRILARAGALEQVKLADGGKALDLLWIRNGQLFDNLGLQAGDRILQINGIDVGDDQAILQAAGQLLNSKEYRIDLLRNGERQVIEVEIIRNG